MALNIVLTNDDGYNAPGIQTLYNALVAAGNNVRIVAPAVNQSAQGSSLGGAAALAGPIAITPFAPGNFYVDGRPATAALVGLDVLGPSLFGGAAPDLVISGTNRGENIGTSETISGTVNGALQGLFEGVPAIAVSAGSAGGSYDAAFANAATFTTDLVARLAAARQAGAPLLPAGQALSINVPGAATLAGVAVTQVTPESSSAFPYARQADGTYAEGFVPNTSPSGSATAEGAQFLANRITVSPVDGNFGATAAARDALAARLSGVDLAGTAPAGGPLNVLLINEDGIGAPGLNATRDALLARGYGVTILAPTTDQSGVGSALFLNPVTITTYDARSYAGNATPASLVSVALDPQGLLQAMPRPDLVVVGADQGRAVGIENANHSATVAAAATALFNYGIPSIALTAASGSGADFATAADFVGKLVANLQATRGGAATLLPAGIGLSVNVPTGASEARYAFTTIDRGTDADLSVAGSASQARFTTTGAVASSDPNAEATAFAAGRITISPIDGSYASTDAAAYDRLAALVGTPYGTPGAGYTAVTDPATGGRRIDVSVPAALTAAAGTASIDTAAYAGFGALRLPGTVENADLTAGTGNNTVTGNGLDNALSGGAGNDLVFGNQGRDLLFGNQGADTLYGGQGGDAAYGGQGDDRVQGDLGDDRLSGDRGNDLVFGNLGADLLLGGQGADSLYGGQGADTLFGGQGDDVLSGDLGDDVLSGDLGADRYVFGQNSGRDLILGFSQGQGDRLDLQGQTYTVGTAASGNALLTLSGGGTVELSGVTQPTFGTGAGYLA
ncbi:5'/3'-nucleotidase SurE [Methylobacterium sp. A54F]